MNFDPNLKISTNFILLLGFTTIISIMVFTHVFSISLLRTNSEKMNLNTEIVNTNSNIIRNMMDAIYERSTILAQIIHSHDVSNLEDMYSVFNVAEHKFTTNRSKLANQDIDENLLNLLDEQEALIRLASPLRDRINTHVKNHETDMAMHIYFGEAMPIENKIYANTNEMAEYQFTSARQKYQTLKQENKKAMSTIIILDIASILISILLTMYVMRKQKQNHNQLSKLATTDILTKLPNRESIIAGIEHIINKNPESNFTIVFIDIDYFKSINDNYGHATGDKVINEFASIIKNIMQPEDILGRLGGDEFVLFIANPDSKEHAIHYVKNLSEALDTSLNINDKEIFISASIGASMYGYDGNTAQTLLKNADIAMYSAKQGGRNCYQFFSDETKSLMEKEHAICYALNTILKNDNKDNQLYLKYQPLLNIKSNDITECEALLRWTTEEGKNVRTDEFIQIAEKTNLIEKVNKFVIKQACLQQKEWQSMDVNNVRININLSGNKRSFTKLLSAFKKCINESGLEYKMFGIELTERTILDVSEETINELEELRNAGMKISIDDFGTGYSSLSYLKKLPITTIKIDKSFISGLPKDKDDHELVKTIITLGHSLKLDVVAEGVETSEQLDVLQQNACDIAQGYFFHRPLEHNEITQMKLAV